MALDKTFDPKAIEKKHYDRAEKSGAFACHPDSDKTPYTIMMPPPNVTGSLHMGHALNTTLQDILIRYHRMKGFDALWQPGTDHAGIATQMVVERMLGEEGTNRHKLGRKKFLERVWQWKEESGGTIVRQMRALGATPDWSRERFTMDEGLSKAVLKAFVTMYKDGLIYKDKRLVNWDPKLQTSISDLEVEQKDQKGSMWHIRYPVESDKAEEIIVATTRPETMLGDTAVAVHPEDKRYKHLIGKFVSLPISGRLIPIVADEYADPEQGSGAVKITPAHDFNDFEVGKRHNLPMINIFDAQAKLNENAPEQYRGLTREEARKKILQELDDMDALVKEDKIQHSVPYGDRSGVVIEPYLTDQWYVDAGKLAIPALEAVKSGKTEFVPKNWENTYFHWMENIQPWCISRQLWWGHQIPAWYGPDGYIFVAETEDEAHKDADAYYGESVTLKRDEDVLDTWFSSALWTFSTLGWPDMEKMQKYHPTDVLITGFDIIFFWVARMMMMTLYFKKEVPFKTVYIHALVRDAKGAKMSKSKGNVMDPLDLTDKYGADALRFTLTSMAAQGRDIRLSEERIEGYRNFCTKLWNASRYCEMNECLPPKTFDPAGVKYIPNQWIIGMLKDAQSAFDQAITEYKFNEAANAMYQFVWNNFCDWYLEFTKPLLQTQSEHTQEIKDTTGWVLAQVFTLLNPVMPFITEELHEKLTGKNDLLMSGAWPDYKAIAQNAEANAEMEWLIATISEIRSVRSDMNVPAGAKINLLVKDANPATQARLKSYDEILRRMARLERVELTDSAPRGSIQTVLGEATLIMPIADIIDLAAEKARLKKQIEKLSIDIDGIDKKLSNESFVQNAPEEIIEEQKSRRLIAEQTRQKLESALKQLEAA